ncbi:immunity protein Imm33 domain-containing protein [Burkholderia singularis]|uniref:immunity protein Imm33 domain-containing protein n=1 Tax=Burkholderia singularis TaxID=1503053 RepID=UPI003CC68ECF
MNGNARIASDAIWAQSAILERECLSRPSTTGGCFHCGAYSDADDFYQPVHTEHLQQILPIVVKYLRLPAGRRFIVDDQEYEDV